MGDNRAIIRQVDDIKVQGWFPFTADFSADVVLTLMLVVANMTNTKSWVSKIVATLCFG